MLEAPRIEGTWVCIAGSDQAHLAAQISSYFNEPGVYFAVFDFPALEVPYQETPEKEGYFTRGIGNRAAITINNCLARVPLENIILAGINDVAASYLRALLPPKRLVIVNNETDLRGLPFAANAPAPLMCRPAQVVEGLLAAKKAKRPLAFDEKAADLPTSKLERKPGLVLLENPGEVAEISIINYATAIDADIVLVSQVEREEIQSLPRQLHEWAEDRSSQALRDARRKITDRIKGIDFSTYKFATFFTVGLPYGLVLENPIPITHVLNGPYAPVLISNSITEALSPMELGSALLFSIDEFISDETNDIAKALEEANFVVTDLIGKNATYDKLDNYGSHLPYDLLHICSHGGETDGYFVKHPFTDREGNEHVMEYFEVVSFSLEAAIDPNNVKVEAKKIFISLDGIPWSERPLSLYPKYMSEDFTQAIKEDDHAKREPVNVPIALSCHIKCYQSFHQGHFDHLAGYTNPIIFNNSCSSSHEIAAGVLAAGARAYIGTLWNVGDHAAMEAATTFYKFVLADGNLLSAFFEMLKSIADPKYRNIYILWGLHFTRLVHPTHKSDERIIEGLLAGYGLWLKKFSKTEDPDLKRNLLPMLRFLDGELRRRVSIDRLRRIIKEKQIAYEQVERSGAEELEFNELVVTKEILKPG